MEDAINRKGSVYDIADPELIRRAINSVRRPARRGGVPLWNAVMGTFGLGSTYAAELCRRFDLDPDQPVRKSR